MLGVSLLVHIAVIYLIPGGEFFPPAQQQEYIELETFQFEASDDSAGLQPEGKPEPLSPAQPARRADDEMPLHTRFEPVDPVNVLDRNDIKNEGTFLADNSSIRLPERLVDPGPQQRPASSPSPQTPAVRDTELTVPQSQHRPEPSVAAAEKQELAVSDITAAAVDTRGPEPESLPVREEPEIDRIPAARPLERLTPSATQGSANLPGPIHMARLASPVESPVQPNRIPQPSSPAMTNPSLRLPETKGTPETVPEDIAITAEELPSSHDSGQTPDTLITPEELTALPVAEQNALPAFSEQPRRFSSALRSQAKRELLSPTESSASSVTFSHQENQKALVRPEVTPEKTDPVSQTFSSIAAVIPLTRLQQTNQPEADLRQIPEIKEKFSSNSFKPNVFVPKNKLQRVSPIEQKSPSTITSRSPQISRKKASSPDRMISKSKSVAYAEEPVFQPIQPSQQRPVIPAIEAAPDDLQQPRATGLRQQQPGEKTERLARPRSIQRSFPARGTISNSLFRQPRSSSYGLFVRKQESLPELPELTEPQKLTSAEETIQQAELQKSQEESPVIVIEGPAAKREVIYKPRQLPKVSIDREVDLRLKFWVLPDGSIGEVIPLQRGDVRLERVAIEYLKHWRFTPVSPSSPKVWGIMPITYKLR